MSSPAAAPEVADRQFGHLFLLVTAVGWGLNWSVLKFVLQDWPPLFARGAAGLLGAMGLVGIALFRGERLTVPREAWPRLVVAAAINVFAWMGFTALSLNWLKVSEGALIAYSMPIWAMLIAWPLLGERPDRCSLLALVLGIAGVCVLMGGPDLTAGKVPGILFALAARDPLCHRHGNGPQTHSHALRRLDGMAGGSRLPAPWWCWVCFWSSPMSSRCRVRGSMA
jgi:drug/metabolite transporter (DMT)-like permease